VHEYEYEPVVLNVLLTIPELKFPVFVGAPAVGAKVTLCATPFPFDQVTVPPRVMVTDAGVKENVAVP
jgi:hypothetical protein